MPNDEIGDLLTEIVKLQRKVSGLTHVAQHLFVLASSNQRLTCDAFGVLPPVVRNREKRPPTKPMDLVWAHVGSLSPRGAGATEPKRLTIQRA